MNRLQFTAKWTGNRELERIVEPLASYICATERPKAALASVLWLLLQEVEATNQTARSCLQN
jgi:hypothetical protein